MSWNPEPGSHHARLQALVGTWEGAELLRPSPWGPGGPAVGRFVNRVAIDGFFVISDYEEVKDGEVTFRGHGVYGWDELDKCYLLYWFDTMGMAPPAPARGQWQGDTLTLVLSQPGAQVRYTHVFDREGEYRFRLESKRDGDDWKTLMEADYRRLS
jgi:hypothetical protein